MNIENLTPNTSEHQSERQPERRLVGEPHLAADPVELDWRRLEVASHRFGDRIADGIAHATERHTGIDHETARCIAHAFGRAFGRTSALAKFGRTGEADYEAMRDEYLQLYIDGQAPAWVAEQATWLGTYLIRQKYPQAETISSNEPYPLTLEELLVPTKVQVGDFEMEVHIPGQYDSAAIEDLKQELALLQLDKGIGLQAYLSLPNVNAFSGDIMEGFHNSYIAVFRDEEDALRSVCDLDQRERDIEDYISEKGLYYDYLIPDWEALRQEAGELVDLVEREGRTYVFYK